MSTDLLAFNECMIILFSFVGLFFVCFFFVVCFGVFLGFESLGFGFIFGCVFSGFVCFLILLFWFFWFGFLVAGGFFVPFFFFFPLSRCDVQIQIWISN